MIKTTSISRCKKSDFKAFEQLDNSFIIRWGKQDEVEQISTINEETGERRFTGEIKETDYCTYESGAYTGMFTPYWLDESLKGKSRVPSVLEYKAMYDGMGLSEDKQLPLLKEKLKAEINRYDKSSDVEDFTIGGVHLWLNHDMRGKVKENLETCDQLGEENTILRFEGMSFPISVSLGWQMYYAVLAYARDCWNTTENHLSAANALTTIEEIESYDYHNGYPNKLEF